MFCEEGEKFEFTIAYAARLLMQRFDSHRDFVEWSLMSCPLDGDSGSGATRSILTSSLATHGDVFRAPESEPRIAYASEGALAADGGPSNVCVILLVEQQSCVRAVSNIMGYIVTWLVETALTFTRMHTVRIADVYCVRVCARG
jgi:hypothetical protein